MDIADDAIELFQQLVTTVDELDLAGDLESGRSLEFPDVGELEAEADALQVRADDAGCDDDELRELLSERVVRLEARTVFGQAVIEAIRQEGLFGEDLFGGTP